MLAQRDYPIINVKKIHKRFPAGDTEITVLRDISFQVEKGEFLSVVGPSGNGKSTLLNMITGIDRPTGGEIIVTGNEIHAMSEEELVRRENDIDIIARASPTNKLQVLKAIQEDKHFAAMTGDGVNDAPALKQADVGIAMGLRGTDAARESAGLVLLDDNYSTIIAAVEEGRRIFDNIRKFVNYLLTCNVGEVLTVLCGVLWGLQPLPALCTSPLVLSPFCLSISSPSYSPSPHYPPFVSLNLKGPLTRRKKNHPFGKKPSLAGNTSANAPACCTYSSSSPS